MWASWRTGLGSPSLDSCSALGTTPETLFTRRSTASPDPYYQSTGSPLLLSCHSDQSKCSHGSYLLKRKSKQVKNSVKFYHSMCVHTSPIPETPQPVFNSSKRDHSGLHAWSALCIKHSAARCQYTDIITVTSCPKQGCPIPHHVFMRDFFGGGMRV